MSADVAQSLKNFEFFGIIFFTKFGVGEAVPGPHFHA